jgi:hypothetical protein
VGRDKNTIFALGLKQSTNSETTKMWKYLNESYI